MNDISSDTVSEVLKAESRIRSFEKNMISSLGDDPERIRLFKKLRKERKEIFELIKTKQLTGCELAKRLVKFNTKLTNFVEKVLNSDE